VRLQQLFDSLPAEPDGEKDRLPRSRRLAGKEPLPLGQPVKNECKQPAASQRTTDHTIKRLFWR
jgi:hypothetical protein